MPGLEYAAAMAASGLIITLLCEITHRRGLNESLVWMARRPGALLCNISVALCAETTVLGLTGNPRTACAAAFGLFFVICCVSWFKFAARNEPICATDALLAFKVFGVADSSNIALSPQLLISLGLGICWLIAPVFPASPGWGAPLRVGLVLAGLAGVGIIAALRAKLTKPDFTYRDSGFILGLSANIALFFHKPRPNPSAPVVDVSATKPVQPETMPDIVMVLSESFWDIGRLPGLRLDADPLSFYRSLKGRTAHGDLVVTQFGGGTCNVESEILLGVCNRHFNISNSFYHCYIGQRPVASLPRLLGDAGYRAAAAHTYHSGFYDRDRAFRAMGFEGFTGIEDVQNPDYCGRYASDGQLFDMITGELETGAREGRPQFLFAISMENHQPYTARKYGAGERAAIHVLNDGLSPKERGCLDAYITGLNHADRQLERLIEHFSRQSRPTVLLFFGDHLGALGPHLSLYEKLGMLKNRRALTPEETIALYSPPFVCWANYDSPHIPSGDMGRMGANFLGGTMLELAGLGGIKTEFYGLLDEVYAQMRCISREDVFIDARGRLLDKTPEGFASLEAAYRAMAYANLGLRG